MTQAKQRKNKVLLSRIIKDTLSYKMNWMYIGSSKDKHVFISPECIIGKKFIIIEIDMYMNKNKNKLYVYMQNISSDDKYYLKEIQYSKKLIELSRYVLSDIASYSDNSEFKEVYDGLIDKYKL